MDVHNFQGRLDQGVQKILDSDMPESNKRALLEFKTSLVVKGLSVARIEHYVFHLRRLCSEFMPKEFRRLTNKDIPKIIEGIESEPRWGARYRHDLKISLRVFLRWLNEKKICSVNIDGLKSRYGSKRVLPEEILTEQEVAKMAEAATHLRDKALVLTLYESGCRIGELMGLKIKHVQSNRHGFALAVDGKTGCRRVLILASAPALANWLNTHPYKNDPEAYVWLGIGNKNKDALFEYHNVIKLLKSLSRKAGLKKRVNPHSFRHARATHLAKYLTEAQMKQYFGWVQGSGMAAIYVHLSGRDVDNTLLKLNGIKTVEEERTADILKPVNCPLCQTTNSPDSKFCCKCGSPLSVQVALGVEQVRATGDAVINELANDSELQSLILRKAMANEQFKAKLKAMI